MKVIVDDKDLPCGKDLKKIAMNEDANYDEVEPVGRVDGEYDFIMMVGNGKVYGFAANSYSPDDNSYTVNPGDL